MRKSRHGCIERCMSRPPALEAGETPNELWYGYEWRQGRESGYARRCGPPGARLEFLETLNAWNAQALRNLSTMVYVALV